MSRKELFEIEGDPADVVWYIPVDVNSPPMAYCKKHLIPFSTYAITSKWSTWVTCPHDKSTRILRNRYDLHQNYVRSMTNREALRDFKVVRVQGDGNNVLAKEKYEKDVKYFIETKLSDTSKGLEVMIQVGKRDEEGKKVQLFVIPPAKRLGFDTSSKDFHPVGLFTEVRAIFKKSETVIKTKRNKTTTQSKSKK